MGQDTVMTQNMFRRSKNSTRTDVQIRLWQTYLMPVIVKNNDNKTVLILTRILQVSIVLNAQVGLLTHPVCRAFPAFASGKECNKPNSEWSRDTQQQVLFRIRTGFPFHPPITGGHRGATNVVFDYLSL